MKRPLALNILIAYLLIVFGISLASSLAGAVQALPPYSTELWLVLALPKVLAFGAGIALFKLLRVGAYLFAAGILLGWALAISLGTGFFPSLDIAAVVSLAIVALSAWVIWKNWKILRPLGKRPGLTGADAA